MHIQFGIFHLIKILFSYISSDYVLLDFWCAFDMLKIYFLKNDFSSKNGIFCMNHRGGYVQKDIIVFKKKIRFPFSDFHYFYPILNIASFESRV